MPERIVPIDITLNGPRGVFAYLVRAGRPFVVDTGVPGQAPRILEAIVGEGIDPQDIALIVITHGHTDHTGSAYELREATGAPVAIHALDAQALEAGDSMPVVGRTPAARELVERMAAQRASRMLAMRPVRPEIVLDGDRSLADLGIEARVMHTPGHTPGGISILLDTGEALVGDLIGADPDRSGMPGLPPFADDVPALETSIRRLIEAGPEVVFTGHEGEFTLAQLREAFAD